MNARLYDACMSLVEPALFGPRRGALLRELHGTVIEIGSGTGLNFAHYAPDARVTALEPDPAMRRRSLLRVRSNITVRGLGDEYLDSIPAGCADAVVCTLVLCSVPDLERTIARIRRVLRPGGKLVVFEHVRGAGLLGTIEDAVSPLWALAAGGCRLDRKTALAIERAGFKETGVEKKKLGLLSGVYVVEESPR